MSKRAGPLSRHRAMLKAEDWGIQQPTPNIQRGAREIRPRSYRGARGVTRSQRGSRGAAGKAEEARGKAKGSSRGGRTESKAEDKDLQRPNPN